MDAKRLPNAFKNNLKTHLKNDVFLVRKMQISKSLQIAPKVPFGKGSCEEEAQNNKPLPYESQHASGAERPGADLSCLRQYTRSGPRKVRKYANPSHFWLPFASFSSLLVHGWFHFAHVCLPLASPRALCWLSSCLSGETTENYF